MRRIALHYAGYSNLLSLPVSNPLQLCSISSLAVAHVWYNGFSSDIRHLSVSRPY